MHLAEISNSENLHNGRPSTLLRCVPVENERCRGGRTEKFKKVRFRLLECCPKHKKCLTRVALGAPENARGGMADLWDTESFEKDGEEGQLMAFSCPMGCTNEKRSSKMGVGRRSSPS